MNHWVSKRAAGALLVGFLAGGIAATGAAGFAIGDAPEQSEPTAVVGCATLPQDTGERVSFGLRHSTAL